MKVILNSLFLLLLMPGIIIAETIYKSVDEEGKVTYSATPPANSEKTSNIKTASPPSEERIKAARDRHKRNTEAANILDENRKKRDAINAEEDRLKREQQKQFQQQQQAEKNNENKDYNYPYIPGHRPGGALPPAHRPIHRPAHRPVQLPAR